MELPANIPSKQVVYLLFSLVFLLLTVIQTNTVRQILTGQAVSSDLTLTIALYGTFDQIRHPSYKTKISFYTKTGKVKEIAGQTLTLDHQNIFTTQVNISDIDRSQLYALYIKPDKFLGRLYCSKESFSSNCVTPQLNLSSQNNLDLTNTAFLGGDLSNQDGKVDSYDLSKIVSDIGKNSSDYLESDINSDAIVNGYDYSLAIYSITKNAHDDAITIAFTTTTPTPTSALSPTVSPIASTTPNPTTQTTPTLIPSSTPNPTSTPIPTATSTPTSTPTPTQTSTLGGTCNGILNGKAYVNAGIFGNQCRKITNEKHYFCVTSKSDCNTSKCIEVVKQTVKDMLPACSNNIATLDEQKTQVTCQTEFQSGNCTPEPTPSCEDNREKC